MNARGEIWVNEATSIADDTNVGSGVARGAVGPIRCAFDTGYEFALSKDFADARGEFEGFHVEAVSRWVLHGLFLGKGHLLVLYDADGRRTVVQWNVPAPTTRV